jgi:23S rRNA (uridine2552-2'-O)-methyltransferase
MRRSLYLLQVNANPFKGDKFTSGAKALGFPSRSIFKLQEIDVKFKLFSPGSLVLDLGCSPGSWSLYAAQNIGDSGRVIGLDLTIPSTKFPSNVKLIQQDVLTWNYEQLPELRGGFDVILSDMMTNTTGDKTRDNEASLLLCARVLDMASSLLKPQGCVLLKLFQGSHVSFLQRMHAQFREVKSADPVATRKHSRETFVFGRHLKKKV